MNSKQIEEVMKEEKRVNISVIGMVRITAFKGAGLTQALLIFLFREEFNIGVLHAFVDLHEFTDLNLVQALR